MIPPVKYIYREEWLHQCAKLLFDRVFIPSGALKPGETMPPYRITCGLTLRPEKAVGQAFAPAYSADQTHELIISMIESDPVEVANTLAHEMIHALRLGAGHGKPFARIARAIGFEAPMTQTPSGPRFIAAVTPILAELGPYPHAALSLPPKATARRESKTPLWVKGWCPFCGYSVKITHRHLEKGGAPHCPRHGEMRIIA